MQQAEEKRQTMLKSKAQKAHDEEAKVMCEACQWGFRVRNVRIFSQLKIIIFLSESLDIAMFCFKSQGLNNLSTCPSVL
jgi:hypothetical protein